MSKALSSEIVERDMFLTAGELAEEHYGWYIQVADSDPVIRHRNYELIRIRKWTYKSKTTVGIVAKDPDDLWKSGIEYHYAPDTAVELIRPITTKAKRSARESTAR